jgi:hypothetical protein
LPANPYVIEQYTVGKVVIGGVTLDDVQSVQIDLNPEVKKLGGSDDVYPTCSYLQRINPRFTLTVLDARRSTAYGLRGSIITDATIYLRRMRNGSDRFADADAVHMKWELAGSNLMAWPTQTSGPEAAESATTLQLQPIETSAQPLWTFSVDVPVT